MNMFLEKLKSFDGKWVLMWLERPIVFASDGVELEEHCVVGKILIRGNLIEVVTPQDETLYFKSRDIRTFAKSANQKEIQNVLDDFKGKAKSRKRLKIVKSYGKE